MPGLVEQCTQHFATADLYSVLGVQKTCTEADIKKAYYKQSLKVHPDRAGDEDKEVATAKFQTLGKVYSILSNQDKRKIYDETGSVDDEEMLKSDMDWQDYWRTLFKKVTKEDIVEFENKYKGSDEEVTDVKNSYELHKGDMDKIMSTVLCATVDDEPRIRSIIQKLIDDESVTAYEAFTSESAKKQEARKRKADKEAVQAEKMAEEMGLKGGDDALAAAILKKNQDRAAASEGFFANLEAKYGGKAAKAKAKAKPKAKPKSKKPADDEEEDGGEEEEDEEVDEEEEDDDGDEGEDAKGRKGRVAVKPTAKEPVFDEEDYEEDTFEDDDFEDDFDDDDDDDDDEDYGKKKPKGRPKGSKTATKSPRGRKPAASKKKPVYDDDEEDDDDDDDDDEDYGKAKPKAKAKPAPKPAPKPAAKSPRGRKPAAAKPPKPVVDDAVDDAQDAAAEEEKPKTPTRSPRARQPVKRTYEDDSEDSEDFDDDDDDDSDYGKKKPAKKARPSTGSPRGRKPKKAAFSDEDGEEKKPPKNKGGRPRKHPK